MFKLIMLTVVGSFIGLLGVKVNGGVQQLASQADYDGGSLHLNSACLSGGLECEVSYRKHG